MKKFVNAPSGHRLLLIWRTEFLFYTPERRRLGDEWNQVRFTSLPLPEGPSLINHRLDEPLPFDDELFDAIYSFHVIEHLRPRPNEHLMHDMYRLLKPGGIYRVATPDLEFLATEYLQRLHEQMASESVETCARYQWALCNLIDQSTREISGGEMLEVICRREFSEEHVRHMNGDMLRYLFPGSLPTTPQSALTPTPFVSPNMPRRALRALRRIAKAITRPLRSPSPPGRSYLELAYERNLWLWDRVSLPRLFSQAGFRNVVATDHRTSSIPDWSRYNFDQSVFGDYPLEPSLYMEGRK